MMPRIPPLVPGEDYNLMWGKIDYKGKKVLDLGADRGSTAEFFLLKGARQVVAVEGNAGLHRELVINCEEFLHDTVPVLMFINTVEHWREVLLKYKPDVVKADIEMYEELLCGVSQDILRIPKEYIIECHLPRITNRIITLLKLSGYEIIDVNLWAPPNTSIVYAKR